MLFNNNAFIQSTKGIECTQVWWRVVDFCNTVGIVNIHFHSRFSFGEWQGPNIKWRGLTSSACFFCIVQLEDNKHLFIQCPIAHALEIFIENITSFVYCYMMTRLSQWIFNQYLKNRPKDKMEIMFLFVRYLVFNIIEICTILSCLMVDME